MMDDRVKIGMAFDEVENVVGVGEGGFGESGLVAEVEFDLEGRGGGVVM
jgi:hypothetical protein